MFGSTPRRRTARRTAAIAGAFALALWVPASLEAEVEREGTEEAEKEKEKAPRPELDGRRQAEFQENVLDKGKKNLEEIRRLLDEVQQSLADRDTGSATQEKQQQAMEKMTQLVDELSKACQQGSSGGGGRQSASKPLGAKASSGSRKPGSDPKQQGDSREQQTGLKSEKQQEQAGRPQGQGPERNDEKVPNENFREGELPESGQADAVRRMRSSERWGLLPQKVRDEMISSADREPPPEYREIIERYYRRLSEYYEERDRGR